MNPEVPEGQSPPPPASLHMLVPAALLTCISSTTPRPTMPARCSWNSCEQT